MKIQNIGIDKDDVKKLKKYQIHPNQPYWEVVKNILSGKINITGEKTQTNTLGSSSNSQSTYKGGINNVKDK